MRQQRIDQWRRQNTRILSRVDFYNEEIVPRLPMVAFSTNKKSALASLIRSHTRGEFSHVMWFYRPGYFASQDWTFREVPVDKYLSDPSTTLELWEFPTWDSMNRRRYRNAIQKQIDSNGFYDFLGIFGQALRFPIINFPFIDYCSEAVWKTFVMVDGIYRWHPSPADLRKRLPFMCGDVYGLWNKELLE